MSNIIEIDAEVTETEAIVAEVTDAESFVADTAETDASIAELDNNAIEALDTSVSDMSISMYSVDEVAVGAGVMDVQENGTSIVQGGIANITDFVGQRYSQANNKAGLVPTPPALAETGQWYMLSDLGWLEAYPQPSDTIPWAYKWNPAFTGIPTAPTAASGTSSTQIATTEFVQIEVDANTEAITNSEIEAITN